MAASNTIHSEPATAISIELGILGPCHVLASGCSAGLDALGIAKLIIASHTAPRALVVAVDLPLVPLLLDSYSKSRLLSKEDTLDPYHPSSSGFIPAEAAAAIALSTEESCPPRSKDSVRSTIYLNHFSSNSDGQNPVGTPKNGGRTVELLDTAIAASGQPTAICPHATGTLAQARMETAIFHRSKIDPSVPILPLKPYLGHSIGASGLLETAILATCLKHNTLPSAFPGGTSTRGQVAD